MKTVEERFWDKVSVTPNCWLWTAHKTAGGYGQFRPKDKLKLAHRVAYEMIVGPIPKGLELDHLCRVHDCVNPSHLEPVTHIENMRRGEQASRTHCPSGHEYNVENTYRHRGHKHCRTCHKKAVRLSWNKKKNLGS